MYIVQLNNSNSSRTVSLHLPSAFLFKYQTIKWSGMWGLRLKRRMPARGALRRIGLFFRHLGVTFVSFGHPEKFIWVGLVWFRIYIRNQTLPNFRL